VDFNYLYNNTTVGRLTKGYYIVQGGPELIIQQYNNGKFNWGTLHRTGWTLTNYTTVNNGRLIEGHYIVQGGR